MTSPTKNRNDITGDLLISKPTNDAYRDNWDRIFGKQKKCLNGDSCYVTCPQCNPPEKDHADSPD